MEEEAEVLIAGAGPVGLTLSLLLAQSGLRVSIVERRAERRDTSRAIGLMPPSLEIFERVGLAERFVNRGIPISHAQVHNGSRHLGTADFSRLDGPYPFVLALPQAETEAILEAEVSRAESVKLHRGLELTDFSVDEARWDATGGRADVARGGVCAIARDSDGVSHEFRAGYLVGADGKRSLVRRRLGFELEGRRHRDVFAMADFADETDLGEEAWLYFTPSGSVESFPVRRGVRRWIVLTGEYLPEPPPGLVQDLVRERTGHRLTARDLWRTGFYTERGAAFHFARPPVFLAGDAAHVIPPIGGQGMNIGIGDAEHLADLLSEAGARGRPDRPNVRAYEARRRRAFRSAASRALLGMKIGTARGPLLSAARDALVRFAVGGPLAGLVSQHFTMGNAPARRSPWRSPVSRHASRS